MSIEEHYAVAGLEDRIDTALAGLSDGPLSWERLAEFDQFHVRGLEASRDLAEGLVVGPKDRVLDAGSGLGGPARYLAATYGCRVVGIELTPLYVEVARRLTAKVGLEGQVQFVQGDATATGFPDDSFDHAVTQHVSMNIRDKGAFYRELYRILKPGGKLAIYDILEGNGEAIEFPVPWAGNASLSFLAPLGEVSEELARAGFSIESAKDVTEQGLAWFASTRPATPPPASLAAILGAEMRSGMANVAKNLRMGRILLYQIVAVKP